MLPQISSLRIKFQKTESETWFFVNERAMITTTLMPSCPVTGKPLALYLFACKRKDLKTNF